MIIDVQFVNQPLSGEYEERLYDIPSYWTCIKLTNDEKLVIIQIKEGK